MTSKERVHIPPSFGIETFYVAQKFTLWYLQNTIKNFNFVISSAIWMKIGMSIEVNFETSNPFRSCYMSGSNQFELVRVSIFIMMNRTEPKQAVQSGSVQSGSVHWFAVRFAGSEPNHANTTKSKR